MNSPQTSLFSSRSGFFWNCRKGEHNRKTEKQATMSTITAQTSTPVYDIKRPRQLFSARDEILHQQLILACTFGNEEFFVHVLTEILALDTSASTKIPSSTTTPNQSSQDESSQASSSSASSFATSPSMEVINRPNYIGQTALMICIVKGHFDLVNRLLSLQYINIGACTFQDKKNALMLAAERGYSGIVSSLLLVSNSNMMSLKASSSSSPLPPSLPSLWSSITIDINAQDFEGKTALMYACAKSNFSSVLALINKSRLKPNLNIQDGNGRTALHHLLIHNFSSINKNRFSLLATGGSGSTGGGRQSSSLQLIQQALIDAKIDTQIRDVYGKTVLDYVNEM